MISSTPTKRNSIQRKRMKNRKCSKCGRVRLIKFFRPRYQRGKQGWQADCNDCHLNLQRARVAANYEKYQRIAANAHYKRTYGISLLEYEEMFKKQCGLCACCGKPESQVYYRTGKVRRLSLDHDHVSGENRALLCSMCNFFLLPSVEHKPDLLEKAKTYLEKYRCRISTP